MIKIKLSRNTVEELCNWIPSVLQEVKYSCLLETSAAFLMLEFHNRLSIWLLNSRLPKKQHGISMKHAECSALLYYIHKADPANDYLYMKLHEVKAELETVFFVKGNLKVH